MSPDLPSLPPSRTVDALRAAGCVFAEDEARLLLSTAAGPAELDAMVERRSAGLPLEHVLGWADFCGLRIALESGVFVPRRRSEFLARQAIDLARHHASESLTVTAVDLCCGSGAVGAALVTALGPARIELHAADIDPAAVRCARQNLADVTGPGRVYVGDLYAPLPTELRGRVDILIANVPYVPADEIELLPAEARVHEPRVALDGGRDGLDMLRRVTESATEWLAPGNGCLLVETSGEQAAEAVDILSGGGLRPRTAECDELAATVVMGTRPPEGRTTAVDRHAR